MDSLETLQANTFNERRIVCDNNDSNVSAYNKLLALFDTSVDDLAITFNGMTFYLFFDAVLSRKKAVYHSVLNMFPLTYMCLDIEFRVFSD